MRLILLILLISGCASKPEVKYITRIETVTVEKPIFRIPKELQELQEIHRPKLPTDDLVIEDKNNHGKVSKVVISSFAKLRSYTEELERRINVYTEALKDK